LYSFPKSRENPRTLFVILFAIGANTLVLSSCDLIGILPLKARKSNQRSKQN
jgi:hypothetical protein